MILIIDTTKNSSLIAFRDDSISLFEMSKKDLEMSHSRLLLSEIDELLKRINKNKEDISHILCVTGPGSYTGSRVGVATTNALRFAWGITSEGISKQEIVEKARPNFKGIICIPSYRGHFWTYNMDTGTIQMLPEEKLEKINVEILLLDAETVRGHACHFTHGIFDYQKRDEIKKWAIQKRKDKKDIVPTYFKAPTITKSKKKR